MLKALYCFNYLAGDYIVFVDTITSSKSEIKSNIINNRNDIMFNVFFKVDIHNVCTLFEKIPL